MMYSPLLMNQFRLVTIGLSDDFDAPVECTLDHFDLSNDSYTEEHAARLAEKAQLQFNSWSPTEPPTGYSSRSKVVPIVATAVVKPPEYRYRWGDYMALSYSWGDTPRTQPISINGETVLVSRSLQTALKTFRSQPWVKAGWKIWIDAICINQKDFPERAREVKRMREVYTRAWSPIIWLGEAAAGSDQVMDLILTLVGNETKSDPTRSLDDVVLQRPEIFPKSIWPAIYEFCMRKYWLRAWVLQEISLGRANMPVLCGDRLLRWIDICRFFQLLSQSDASINVNIIPAVTEQAKNFDVSLGDVLNIPRRIRSHQKDVDAGKSGFDLYQVTAFSRLTAATDDRDKVYGILALMDRKLASQIVPDYTAPVEQVYTDFARLAINVTGSLDIMRHVALPGIYVLPSWVPDWTSNTYFRPLSDTPHKASGTRAPEVTCPKPELLGCRGFAIDTFDGLGCVWRNDVEVWPSSTVIQSSYDHNAYGSFEGMQEALWKSLVAGRDAYQNEAGEQYSALLAVPTILRAIGKHENERLDIVAASHLFSYCAGFLNGNASLHIAGRPLPDYLITNPDYANVNAKVLSEALMARDNIGVQRRLFTTRKGYIGMALHDVVPSDVICILYGCSSPMVLRETDGGYLVVGECYLHGMMEGEALDLQKKEGLEEKEFLLCGRNVDVYRSVNHQNYEKGWKYTE